MATYKVKRHIQHDGTAFDPGHPIELTDEQAAQFKDGQIEPLPVQWVEASEEPAVQAEASAAPASEESAVGATPSE